MFKGKKGGIIGFILVLIIFNILLFLGLGNIISQIGSNAITTNNLTGYEAFFYANLNVWIIIIEFIGMLAYGLFGSSQ